MIGFLNYMMGNIDTLGVILLILVVIAIVGFVFQARRTKRTKRKVKKASYECPKCSEVDGVDTRELENGGEDGVWFVTCPNCGEENVYHFYGDCPSCNKLVMFSSIKLSDVLNAMREYRDERWEEILRNPIKGILKSVKNIYNTFTLPEGKGITCAICQELFVICPSCNNLVEYNYKEKTCPQCMSKCL